MRTRIALVAIVSVALITISILTPAASMQPVRAASASASASASSAVPVALPPSALAAYHGPRPITTVLTGSSLLVHLNPALEHEAALHQTLLQNSAAATGAVAPAAAPARHQPPPPPRRHRPVRSIRSRLSNGAPGSEWPCARRAATGPPTAVSSVAVSASAGPTGSPTAAASSLPRAPWPREDQQIMVAERIQPTAPDQYGCHGW